MSDRAKPYMNPYLAGTLLGIVLFLAFFITGSGLGASGGLNRMLVYVQNLFVPEHIDQVPYLLKMAGGDTNPLNSWIVYLTAGTIIGGFISGIFGRRIKLETNKGPQISDKTRWIMAFIGGARSTARPGLHIRPGAFRWGRAVRGQLGLHAGLVRRRLCAGLLLPPVLELGGYRDD